MPMLRRAGTGSASSASSEIATVVPLKTTDGAGVPHGVADGDLVRDGSALALLAPADDDEERVVDRDAEPDERDEELDDHGDVGDAGERPDEQERRRDRDERHQQRHDRHERAEDEDQDEQGAERAEQRLDEHPGAARVAVGRRSREARSGR